MKQRICLIKNKKGFSLIELLITLFIIAFVLGAVMSIFIQSVLTRNGAEKLTRANATAQKFSESLYTKTLPVIMDMQTTLADQGNGYYLTFKAKPMGSMNDVTSYMQIVYGGAGCTLVGPDGKNAIMTTAPNSILLTVTAATYTLTYDGTTISGSKPSGNMGALIYATQKSNDDTKSVTLPTGMKAIYYCKKDKAAVVSFTGGAITVYEGVSEADKCLLRTIVEVYKDSAGKEKLTTIEAIIQVNNTGGAA